jgi:hypothetical protein
MVFIPQVVGRDSRRYGFTSVFQLATSCLTWWRSIVHKTQLGFYRGNIRPVERQEPRANRGGPAVRSIDPMRHNGVVATWVAGGSILARFPLELWTREGLACSIAKRWVSCVDHARQGVLAWGPFYTKRLHDSPGRKGAVCVSLR